MVGILLVLLLHGAQILLRLARSPAPVHRNTAVRLVQEAGGRIAAHQPPDRDLADRDLDRLRIMLDPGGAPVLLVSE